MNDPVDLNTVVRDILARRKLQGDPLSPEEELALNLLNHWLDLGIK